MDNTDYIEGGYILLARRILDSETFKYCKNNDEYRLLIESLIRANFQENVWNGIRVKRGQFITGIEHFAQETQTTRKKVRNFWKKFTKLGFLIRQTTNKYTIITVLNYDKYQAFDNYSKKGNQNLCSIETSRGKKGNQKGKQDFKEISSGEESEKGNQKGKQGANKGQQISNDISNEEVNKEIFQKVFNIDPKDVIKGID